MVLDARLEQNGILKKALDAVKDLCKEVNFECDEKGIGLQAMDSSHVALVSMFLSECAFSEYKCTKHTALGVNVESLSKIFKLCGQNDTVTIRAEDDADRITFVFESPEADKMSDFDLKLVDLDAEALTIPEQDYGVKVDLPAAELQRICKDLQSFGDQAVITANKEFVKFTVLGDVGSGNVTLKPNRNEKDPVIIQVKNNPTSATYGLRFLNLFTKATGLCSNVELRLSDEIPMVVTYLLVEEKYGFLKFYLAPKIDD